MSVLGIIEKLLDGFEVEWKKFDEVGVFLRGKRFVKADMKSEGVPCIHYGEMYTHFGVHAKEAKSFLDETVASKLRVANPGDVVIVAAGETVEDIGNGTAWLGESDVVFHDACFSFKSSQDPKYVAYYLRTNLFKEQIRRSVSSGKISSINAKGLGKAAIPIPCPDNPEKSLAIQAEIVRILDAFTDMTAELTTELTAELNLRKKQYNYYRDKLLSFGDGEVEWKTLGEVTQLITKGTTPKEFVSDGVNFIKLESFDDNRIKPDKFMFITPEVHNKALKRSVLEENDILFAIAGATIGKCAIVDKSVLPANTNQALAIVRLTQQVKVKFAFYYMQTTAMTDYIAKFNKTSAQPNINLKQMSEFKIPVPSINEQIRIIQILDNFNTSTSSIKEGLLREIELRQKQYEYYRDLLLSFPKSNEGAA
ncbi:MULTISPECIES: restriction endonuclease subunit S [Vibrio]|uniref:restriction endonuclease subunit S n=1 Tax=Vibrio TaxID=662 RepID=UPI000422D234|nr:MULTISPECIES: restriction endonuclease subunit S [Vibrio]MDW1764622.1 restriction endonuclease subunit S [Vibrio sp. Vb2135]TOE38229.1 restriction endonuclease subunit S [Vibrio parahaemolyticus]HCE2907676.1 restriction endonuclease subunit S [Vibrio parahaemolyticus]